MFVWGLWEEIYMGLSVKMSCLGWRELLLFLWHATLEILQKSWQWGSKIAQKVWNHLGTSSIALVSLDKVEVCPILAKIMLFCFSKMGFLLAFHQNIFSKNKDKVTQLYQAISDKHDWQLIHCICMKYQPFFWTPVIPPE